MVMTKMVPVSEAKARLTELVRDSNDSDVVFTRHGRAAAVMMSVDRHAALMEQLDDLEDRLSVHEREGVTISIEKLGAELGLDETP